MTSTVAVSTGQVPSPLGNYSQAVRAGPLIYVAGQLASDFRTGLAPEARVEPGFPYYGVPMKLQTEYILKNISTVLEQAGSSLDETVAIWCFLTDINQTPYMREVRNQYLRRPFTTTAVGITHLAVAETIIEIDLIGTPRDGPWHAEAVQTDRAPIPPPGRYAQAVKVGPYVFASGQLPTDFVSSVAPAAQTDPRFPFFGRDIARQAAYVLDNIRAVMEEAGSSLDNVVKTLVFLTNNRDLPGLEDVWRAYFPKDPPARSIVPARLNTPGCRLEIQAVGVVPDGQVRKEVVATDRAPTPTIHQSQAIKAGDLVFLSGLMATDYESPLAPAAQVNPAFPYHGVSMKRQMEYIFDTAEILLAEAGTSLARLVRRQSFLSDMPNEMPAFREVTRERLKGVPNASTTIGVGSELIIPACTVLIDAMAVTA